MSSNVMETISATMLPASTTILPDVISSIATATAAAAAAMPQQLDAATALHHNQITFEIPSHRDLEQINSLHSFNTLLKRIGNVAYDTVAASSAAHQHDTLATLGGLEAAGHAASITNEQISKSVVLDLADLKSGTANGLERFFAGADMHSIINYLWIGVVTSLVILSVIFIIFSCYFYRKFREWKKCNKDIRTHLHNDMYPGGRIVTCDSLLNANGQPAEGAAYYQLEAPPCYTIATGLPTYDEALHHQQHFAYGMKFVYPTIAAVHHHPAMSGGAGMGGSIITGWEKEPYTLKCREQQPQRHQQQQQQQQQQSKSAHKATVVLTEAQALPCFNDSAPATTCIALLAASSKESEAVNICIEAPTTTTTTITATDALLNDNNKVAGSCDDVVVVVA